MNFYDDAAINGGESIAALLGHRVKKGSAAAARKMAYLRSLKRGGKRSTTKSIRKSKGGLLGALGAILGTVGLVKAIKAAKQAKGSGILSDEFKQKLRSFRPGKLTKMNAYIDRRLSGKGGMYATGVPDPRWLSAKYHGGALPPVQYYTDLLMKIREM